MTATALAHVTVWSTPGGTLHAYSGCSGAGRHAGHLAKKTMTVATLTEVPAESICRCLRHRWGGCRQDLGLAPRFKDVTAP